MPRVVDRAAGGTYGDGEVHDVVELDDVLVLPNVLEHVVNDAEGFVPDELVVPL